MAMTAASDFRLQGHFWPLLAPGACHLVHRRRRALSLRLMQFFSISCGCIPTASRSFASATVNASKMGPFCIRAISDGSSAHDVFLDPGKYKVTIEVQGRDFVPVRKQFVFWEDKTGQHCVDANDSSAQSTAPLEFAPIDLDTLPAEMHPHQLRAQRPNSASRSTTACQWKQRTGRLIQTKPCVAYLRFGLSRQPN